MNTASPSKNYLNNQEKLHATLKAYKEKSENFVPYVLYMEESNSMLKKKAQ